MNKAVPWSIKGVDFNAREAAKEAARRSGMTLGEWLNSVIADQADELGIDPDEVDDNQKVEAVSRRLARMAPEGQYRQDRQPSRGAERVARDDGDDLEVRRAERKTLRRRRIVEEEDDRGERYAEEGRAARQPVRYAPARSQTPYDEPADDEPRRAYRPRPLPDDFDREPPNREPARREAMRDVMRQAPQYEAPQYEAPRYEAPRYDAPYDPAPREAEALLDDAIRGLERGSRRHQAQTNATLDKFSRRLAELEAHLNERAERAAARGERRGDRRAAIADEAADESPRDRNGYFAAIDKKLSLLAERIEGGAGKQPAATLDPDMQRIEAKLNALLNRPQSVVEAPVAAGPRYASARPPSQLAMSEALSQIARRQRDLDQQPERAPSLQRPEAPRFADIRPEPPLAPPPAPDLRETSALRGDIAALSASLEALRRDMKQRESEPAVAPAAASAVEQLRQQIAEMNTVVGTLPQRESFSALEAATRDLISRVENSRQEGVRENILQPIEALAEHIQRVLTESSPRATIDAIKREIGVIAQSVSAVPNSAVDAATLSRLNEQIREIRELLTAAAARPLPVENIERQIADLARRIDLIAQRGSTASGSQAVSESVDAIRQTVQGLLPTSLLHTLEQRVEALARKIDEVVHPEPQAPVETRALEDMMRDIAARLDRPVTPVVGDFSQLEESVRELARRVDTAGRPDAPTAAFNALEEQIARLASRLDQSDVSLGRLPDVQRSLGEIVDLIEQNRSQAIDAAEQAAKTAAREAMAQIGALTSSAMAPAPDPARGQIVNEIAGLRDGQEAMDRRTRATLTAVHETLEKVVDRLAMIEGGYHRPAQVAPVERSSFDLDSAPRLPKASPDMDLLASGPAPSFSRAAPQLQTGEPTAEGLGRQVSADHIMRASGTTPGASARDEAPPAGLEEDILLEPGTTPQMRKGGAPARRVAPPVEPAEQDIQPAPGSAQQSFIAAARRARETAITDTPPRTARNVRGSGDDALAEARARAKAAAAALAADADEDEDSKVSVIGRARAFINQRKRPILLSLAGIVLALGALTVVRTMTEEAPPSRPAVGAVQSRDTGKIQTQAQPRDQAQSQRATAGITAPVTADELAALGNKFVQQPATNVATNRDRQPATPTVQQVLGNTDAAPVGSVPTALNPAAPGAAAKAQDLRAAATSGNADAQYELASRLFEGRTVPRDLAQAAQWFEKAALQNLAPAQYRLGSLYEKGVGVTRDPARAKVLYQRAADRGNVRAMHNLAVLYAEGADGKPDYASAAQWFRKASEHGVRDSQYNLAILYARGLGIGQDLQQSWVWFSLASAQGDEDAGKKRNDVAGRLNAQQLAAAKAIVESFKPRTSDTASNEVATPAGGWELTAPAAAGVSKPDASKPDKRSAPSAPPARPKVTSL